MLKSFPKDMKEKCVWGYTKAWEYETKGIRNETLLSVSFLVLLDLLPRRYYCDKNTTNQNAEVRKGRIIWMSGTEYAPNTLHTCIKMATGNLYNKKNNTSKVKKLA